LERSKENIALMAIWTPELAGRQGPKYLQIVEALAEDVASGALKPGTRLPPHRALAYGLDVSPNTTQRAYAEAVARALIQGEVGRGTFVRGPADPPRHAGPADMMRPVSGPVDLSRNLPAPGLAAACLTETLSSLAQSSDLRPLVDHQMETALDHHLKAAVDWLGRLDVAAMRDEVVITNGAQHAIFCALMALTRPGDLLLTEELTYAPVMAMADRLGLKRKAVALDHGGLCADALEEVCRGHQVRALYFSPTLQTPTTVTMTRDRREAIVAICRRHSVMMIEDDVFGPLKADRPDPVATLAPESTIYVTSTSKCLAPGLRVGFIRAPAVQAAAIRGAVHLNCWMTPPLMIEIAARWIRDGTADRLTERQREKAGHRQDLARAVFTGADLWADPFGLHLWLRLPADYPADLFKAAADHHGVRIVEGSAFAAESGIRPNAVRLCLGNEAEERRLLSGLRRLKAILDERPRRSELVL